MTTTERVELLSGLLGMVALIIAVAALVVIGARRLAPSAPSLTVVMRAVNLAGPTLTLGVAWSSVAGSLYFSEVADFVPCNLCWYQRIAMYSIAVIATLAWILRDRTIAPYVLTLSLVGLSISGYHYLVEWNPQWETDICSLDTPCTTIWFRTFGFMSLPFLAGCGFLALAALALVQITTDESETESRRS